MRFELLGYTIDIHKKLIEKFEKKEIPEDLREAFKTIGKYAKKKVTTYQQIEAGRKANMVRQIRTREKIREAIFKLKSENKPINQYQITKKSGCSVNTVRKFMQENKSFIEKVKS